MGSSIGILLGTLMLTVPTLTQAADLVVSHAEVVEPDAALLAVISDLRSIAGPGNKADMAKVEAFFGPKVKVFQRGLDPFEPWNRSEDMTDNYLNGTAAAIVEQGDFPEGASLPDYRTDAMTMIAGLIGEGATFGKLKEAPGSFCAPAAYKVDHKAALAFAKRFELDAYSLRFFATGVEFHEKPSANSAARAIPANTLMMFDYDPKLPEGWGTYETSGGTKGYMQDRDDTVGLAQHHICFAKVKGKYRISAIFGYGL